MRNGPYKLALAPDDYPGVRYRGRYVYEHQLVWWYYLGQLVEEGQQIIHKNGDKCDNRLDNLIVVEKSLYTSQTHKPKKYKKLECSFCRTEFQREVRNYNFKYKHGQRNFYCCRSCQVKDQQS